MIGVICKNHEREIVQEVFELFKTPWEFYTADRTYDTVLCSTGSLPEVKARLIVVYGAGPNSIDEANSIVMKPQKGCRILDYEGNRIPVYRDFSVVAGGKPLCMVRGETGAAATEISGSPARVIRAGYSLFAEVEYLLTEGQPINHAMIPTLDLHIDMLRAWILESGIPLLEIPPIPAGYSYIACLTHDVDFIRIRQHVFSRAILGFAYRGFVGSIARYLRGDLDMSGVIRNWTAILKTPLVCLGLAKDFWLQFDRYMEIERGPRSTFFLVPFSRRITDRLYPKEAARRATRYDIGDVAGYVRKLQAAGFEIGVHGIEAYARIDTACGEYERVRDFTSGSEIGIRMHHLMFNRESPEILDDAGYFYDSTFGYNETVGYRAGTAQAFRFPGTSRMLELPMLIHDMAMFSSRRLRLTDFQAWELCRKVLDDVSIRGGAVTTLWHMRSVAPERLWGKFYLRLIGEMRAKGAWFGTAGQVTAWFNLRRAIRFEDVRIDSGLIRVKLRTADNGQLPPVMVRLRYPPDPKVPVSFSITQLASKFMVFPFGDSDETLSSPAFLKTANGM